MNGKGRSAVGAEHEEDQHARYGHVQPYREGNFGNFAMDLQLTGKSEVEAGKNHRQNQGGENNMGNQNEEIDRPDNTLAGKGGTSMEIMIDDIAD